MKSYNAQLADAIASAIISKSRKHWRSLQDDAVRKIQSTMSTPTSSNGLNATPQPRPAVGREATIDRANPSSVVTGTRLTAPATDNINSGFTCGSQLPAPAAKPVDFKTVVGSYAGDHRSPSVDTAKASLDAAADNGGPRNPVGQFKNARSDNGGSFQQTIDPTDAGN
jgi:hypothetical protein